MDDEDEDEEGGGAIAAAVRTKNEFPEPEIMIPPVLQVGPDEQLERVGEIMNIVNNVVIVKGGGSGTQRASEHTLDAETLLVYDDRKVLGYVSTIQLSFFLLTHGFLDPRDFRANIPANVSSQVQQLVPVGCGRSTGVTACVSRSCA